MFLSHSTETYHGGTLLCFRKILVLKTLRNKKRDWYHVFPSKIYFFHSTKKLRRGTLLSFRKFLVSKNFNDKGGGCYDDFLSTVYCLTVPKQFVGKRFLFSEKFWHRKSFCIREGGGRYRIFFNSIVAHSTETFRSWTLLCFRKNPASKVFLDWRGVGHFSFDCFLSIIVTELFVGEPFSVQLISGIEKSYA